MVFNVGRRREYTDNEMLTVGRETVKVVCSGWSGLLTMCHPVGGETHYNNTSQFFTNLTTASRLLRQVTAWVVDRDWKLIHVLTKKHVIGLVTLPRTRVSLQSGRKGRHWQRMKLIKAGLLS